MLSGPDHPDDEMKEVFLAGYRRDQDGTCGFEWRLKRVEVQELRAAWIARGGRDVTALREVEAPWESKGPDEITALLQRMPELWEPRLGEGRTDKLIEALEAAGWPDVAADVRDGINLEDVWVRLRHQGQGASWAAFAVEAVARGKSMPSPYSRRKQRTDLVARVGLLAETLGDGSISVPRAAAVVRKIEKVNDAARQGDDLDAADALATRCRRELDLDPRLVARREEVVREHLAAKEPCAYCDEEGNAPRPSGAFGKPSPCRRCGGCGYRGRNHYELGEQLRELCATLLGLGSSDSTNGSRGGGDRLFLGLLEIALEQIDWYELADSYLLAEREKSAEN